MHINDYEYFSVLGILKESENICNGDLEVYINHLYKLRDFKRRFGDIGNVHVPEWLGTPIDMKMDNKCYESDLEDELIEINVDFEPKELFKCKNLCEYWSKNNTATKYPNLRAAAERFLPAFPSIHG